MAYCWAESTVAWPESAASARALLRSNTLVVLTNGRALVGYWFIMVLYLAFGAENLSLKQLGAQVQSNMRHALRDAPAS
eukprot:1960814-Amphidinium_carterae.1